MRIYPIILLVLCCTYNSFSQSQNDSLIAVLKSEIEKKDKYVDARLKRIDNLYERLGSRSRLSLQEKFTLYNGLYHLYKTFIYDSAFAYAHKLIETSYALEDQSRIDYARLKLAFILVSSGMFKETFDSLNVVSIDNLPDSSRVEYYRLMARAYSDLNIYNKDTYYKSSYAELHNVHMDSALRWCDNASAYCSYLSAVKQVHTGRYEDAILTLKKTLENPELPHPLRAICSFELGNAYKATGDLDNYIKCTALASISDLKAATKETAAMHHLANVLYEQGDVANAYILIQQALDDAEFYGARQRKVEIGSILPVIAAAHLNTVDNQRKAWLAYSSALTILAGLVIAFAVIIFRQLKKLKAAEMVIKKANIELQSINQKLQEADKIKEEYIGYYFGNNSDYIDKLETFKRNIDRKIQSRKVDDIRYVVDTLNPAHEREELYFNFDNIFLKLFPDFVRIFNSYFEPEDRIVLKEGQLLNTELRIFALIRLGIHDAEKIARILGYSVNTIYAYKNRVKSKSIIPNEEFEGKIMQIRTVPVTNA